MGKQTIWTLTYKNGDVDVEVKVDGQSGQEVAVDDDLRMTNFDRSKAGTWSLLFLLEDLLGAGIYGRFAIKE